jgi:molybdate transport system ATP-binding protein
MSLNLHLQNKLSSGKREFHLDVHIESQASRIVIYGPSGAGKSMTLGMIAGLFTPDAGRVILNGVVLFDHDAKINLKPQARNVAYLFQDYALFPHLTVRQNIAFAATRGLLNPRAHFKNDTLDYWLDAFQLTQVAHQYPFELSGGQKQRTALARSLMMNPNALLLDEPFSALDSALRAHMRRELSVLQERLKVPMILITHDPEDARVFGEHLIFLNNGRVDPNGKLEVPDKSTAV